MKRFKLKLKWKIIFSIIIFIIVIYSLLILGTKGLKVKEYKIINNKLDSFYGLKIVHFSDLLYGNGVNEKKLKKLVNMINLTKPDIVIFTGDLIAKNKKIDDNLVNMITNNLKNIEFNYGKYYVTGENDKNNTSYKSIMQNSGFIELDNNYEIINSKDNSKMIIVGMDIDKSLSNEVIEAINLNDYNYKIMAVHYPDKIDDILKYNFDLILSGHSLNGQIRLPVTGNIFSFKNAKKYNESYYKIDNSDIYISNGIGNIKYNLRLFNKPSFNLYRLVDK